MANEASDRSLSLVPYAAQQIVLRHGSAVVVFDEARKQLVASATALEHDNCPYCHRRMPDNMDDGPTNDLDPQNTDAMDESNFVSPSYFRMLAASPSSVEFTSERLGTRWQLTDEPDVDARVLEGLSEETDASAETPTQKIDSKSFQRGYFKAFFVEEGELGRGGHGIVLLVRHVLDGVDLGKYACKRVPVGDDHKWLERALTEVSLLQNLSHQNLVSYKHVWLEEQQISRFGPRVPCAFILQQYCNAGDLQHYVLGSASTSMTKEQLKDRLRSRSKGQQERPIGLQSPRRLHLDEIFSFFRDITTGLRHLHANGYIHRDLKPNNCLLHRTGDKIRVLVSDFGEMQSANVARKGSGATGSMAYSAPEVLQRQEPMGSLGDFTEKSDVFSLGMILYFMCFGRLPYSNADDINEENEDLDLLRVEIAEWAGIDDERSERSDLPERLYKFLKMLLSRDPEKRPSTQEILHLLKTGSMSNEHNSPSPVHRNPQVEDYDPRRSPTLDSPPLHTGGMKSKSSVAVRPGFPEMRPPSDSKIHGSQSFRRQSIDKPNVPRLMAPPQRISTTRRLFKALRIDQLQRLARLALLGAKAWSLLQVCDPWPMKRWTTVSLMVLAGFDLTVPPGRRDYGRISLMLLALHVGALWLTWQTSWLCEGLR